MNCELCKQEKLTVWLHEDNICFICKCKSCYSWMIVLKRHGKPTPSELQHLKRISHRFFPHKIWRCCSKNKEHWHEHFV